MPEQTGSYQHRESPQKTKYENFKGWAKGLMDSPILAWCGCELLLPFILVGCLLVAVAGATIKATERIHLVTPWTYPAWRVGRAAAGAGAAIAFIVCGISGLCAGVGLTCLLAALEGGGDGPFFPTWLLALSLVVAGISAVLNVKLRTVAESLESVQPLNNEYVDGLPADQLLLRSASADTSPAKDLLRPAEQGHGAYDPQELGHVDE